MCGSRAVESCLSSISCPDRAAGSLLRSYWRRCYHIVHCMCEPASLWMCCHCYALNFKLIMLMAICLCVACTATSTTPHASHAPSTHQSTNLVDCAKSFLHLLATAGQGYIWLAHRQPNSPGWAIAQRSKQLWESMIDAAETPSTNRHCSKKLGRKADIEWQVTPLHSIIWLCSTQLCCLLALKAATQVLLSCLL